MPKQEQKTKKFRVALTYTTEVIIEAKDFDEANYIANNYIEDYLYEAQIEDADIWKKEYTITDKDSSKFEHKNKSKDITIKYPGGETTIPAFKTTSISQDGDNIRIQILDVEPAKGTHDLVVPGKAQDIFDQISDAFGGVTRHFRVYGEDGHRQKESFNSSVWYNFSTPEKIRLIQVLNSDITGTNEYTELVVQCNTIDLCDEEMEGQVCDGIFENCRVGKVVEL